MAEHMVRMKDEGLPLPILNKDSGNVNGGKMSATEKEREREGRERESIVPLFSLNITITALTRGRGRPRLSETV